MSTIQKSVETERLCSSIFTVNKNIQSVTIINKNGRPIENMTRESTYIIPYKENEMLLMQCALTISMGRDFDECFGQIGYTFVARKNLSMFSFPIDDNVILVTCKANISPISIARKIMIAINENNTVHSS
ncbi:MAG TPA: hypothetical protein VGR54_04635 [Nitrosopumilaceae archaeon]|nr:hypothetical protein [Nitrosopumilaceae archaeon]